MAIRGPAQIAKQIADKGATESLAVPTLINLEYSRRALCTLVAFPWTAATRAIAGGRRQPNAAQALAYTVCYRAAGRRCRVAPRQGKE